MTGSPGDWLAARGIYACTLFGTLFGALFPLGAWVLDLTYRGWSFDLLAVAELHRVNPVHWLTDCAPFVLGMAARLVAHQRKRVVDLNEVLQSRVAERTETLQTAFAVQEQIVNQLLEARDEAQEALEVRTQFLAAMSHELRTPMIGIVSWLELVDRGNLNAQQSRALDVAHRSATSMLEMVNSLLDFAKAESGGLHLDRAPYNPAEIAETVFELMSPTAAEKELRFVLEVPESLKSRWYWGDATRISQVLTNLVGNALKFTPSGQVRVKLEERAGALLFSVTDTGIGIAEKDQSRIFRAFEQADLSTTRRFGGTGLGLSISCRITRALGGNIEVKSEVGVGSTFRVEIPAEPAEAPLASYEGSQTIEAPVEAQWLRALLVEDNPINAEVLGAQLDSIGVCSVWAMDGFEAVRLANEERFDLVLMDLHMPGMDGPETAKQIRQSLPDIPIVALTASDTDEDRAASQDAGMDGYLVKPLSVDALAKSLRPMQRRTLAS